MSIAIGCDEAGLQLKETIKEFIKQKGLEIDDYGVYNTDPVLYPDIAFKVAEAVQNNKSDRGILICGTGIGMSISANKVKGIRAAVCHDLLSTERARKSNDAQIMCLGARIIAPELALMYVDIWLDCEFSGGNSAPKVDRIKDYEI